MVEECNEQKDQVHCTLHDKHAKLIALNKQLSDLQEDQPCKLPRWDPSPGTPTSSCSVSDMDEDSYGTCPMSAPPQLLSYIQPSYHPGLLANIHAQESPPTHITTSYGFPVIIPVIFCCADNTLHTLNPSVPLTPNGQLDFYAHMRYVLATRTLSPDGTPNFQTLLIWHERFLTPEAIAACKINQKIPLVGLVFRGRNGALISPDKDPRTQTEVDALFNAPDKIGHAWTYTECIRFTPPELHRNLHSHALEQWTVLQENTIPTDRPEPLPATHPTIWRRWLCQKRNTEGHFSYIGIPLVGNGYQSAHIEGNRALLAFLPLNIRGTAICKGPLWYNFLSAAVALLGVPQRYEQLLTQEHLLLHQTRRFEPYSEAQFGAAYKLDIEQIARFLAWSGVRPEEAEQWCPWATAYIEMELSECLDSTYAPTLKQARDRARKCIAESPALALKSIHVDALGNYNPATEQSWGTRNIRSKQKTYATAVTSQCPEVEPTIPPLNSPKESNQGQSAPIDEGEIHNWDNKDTRMGLGWKWSDKIDITALQKVPQSHASLSIIPVL
jgi:hypothetical protein